MISTALQKVQENKEKGKDTAADLWRVSSTLFSHVGKRKKGRYQSVKDFVISFGNGCVSLCVAVVFNAFPETQDATRLTY